MSQFIVRDISASIRAISPKVQGRVAGAWRAVRAAAKKTAALAAMAWVRLRLWLRALVARFLAVPLMVKLLAVLVTFLAVFVVWQLFAYDLRQTTFISVNLILAAGLTVATSCMATASRRKIAEGRAQADELRAQLERRDAELSKLKSDVFELRNKERRNTATRKGGQRFVEAVRALKMRATPDEEKYQFVVDALAKSFDVSGVVIFARDAEGADTFSIAGRYALADDPPTKIVSSGDGILGQVVADDKPMTLTQVPKEYLTAISGLGKSRSLNVYALPLKAANSDEVTAVMEVACFAKLAIVNTWDALEEQLREIL